jgi:ABC-type amino acid transport substrate-binding protein
MEPSRMARLLIIWSCTTVQTTGIADPSIPWDESLESARRNPSLVAMMADKYDPLVEKFLKAIDQTASDQELAELLKKWKPTTPPN